MLSSSFAYMCVTVTTLMRQAEKQLEKESFEFRRRIIGNKLREF